MKILLYLLFLISCRAQVENFWEKFQERIIYAHKVELINFNKKELKIPHNTWFLILEYHLMSKNYYNIKDCLFYYTNGEKHELKWVQNAYNCQDPFQEGDIFQVDKMINLDFQKNTLLINLSKEQYSFHLMNSFKNQNQQYTIDLYSNGIDETLLNGIKVISPYIQDKFQRPLFQEGETCHDVNDDCSDIIPNQCHLCPNGWYSEIHGNCSKTLRKKCGNINCGKKGHIACLRGFVVTNLSFDFCFPDSPIGFCEEGARVICKDKILYCE